MKTLILAFILILILMIGLITLYFIQFNGGLSDTQTDWGTFGDYLSGIFAVFNLGVVVLLTVFVSNNEDKRIEQARIEQQLRNEQELKFQKERSERELEFQRKLLLSQLRYNDFQIFETELNKIKSITVSYKKSTVQQLIAEQILVLGTYRNKSTLYPVFKEPEFKEIFDRLGRRLHEVAYGFVEGSDYVKGVIQLTLELSTLKENVQKFIIDELQRG